MVVIALSAILLEYGQLVMVETDFSTGGIMIMLGLLLMFAFLVMLLFEGSKFEKEEFSCPRCQKAISRLDSLNGCAHCDLPINWSEATEGQKVALPSGRS